MVNDQPCVSSLIVKLKVGLVRWRNPAMLLPVNFTSAEILSPGKTQSDSHAPLLV